MASLRNALTGDDRDVILASRRQKLVQKAYCHQDEDLIRSYFEELQRIKLERPALFRNLPYTIREKSANEKARFQKLLQYQGPDARTLDLLQEYGDSWTCNPVTFWTHSSIQNLVVADLQAKLVITYQRMKHLDS